MSLLLNGLYARKTQPAPPSKDRGCSDGYIKEAQS